MDRLKGKVAIITGGVSGIGRAACLLLAREGAKIAVTDINDGAKDDILSRIMDNGSAADYWHMDVTDEKEIEKVFIDVHSRYGRIDILVNSAGIPGPPKATHELTTEEWDRVIDINLKGVFFCIKHAYRYLKMAGGGSIINISSMLGIIGGEDPVYHASKGGVRLMTKSDASIYAKDNIRVNSVHPGYILTPLFKSVAARNPKGEEAFLQELSTEIPLGRPGTPEDVANGILFLASDESSYITGTELVIDGGYMVR